MNRRAALLTAVAALGVVPAASASTAVLSAQRGPSAFPAGEGRVVFATEGTPAFTVALTDDAGRPVTECLQDGVELQVIDAATGQVLGTDGCPDFTGFFSVAPTTRKTPYTAVAVVPAALAAGVAVSPVQSAPLRVLIRPEIIDNSPQGFVPGATFPLRGQVDAPRANRAGRVALELRVGRRWVRKQVKPLPAGGRFQFAVTGGRWRVRFLPKTASGYAENARIYTITRRRVPTG